MRYYSAARLPRKLYTSSGAEELLRGAGRGGVKGGCEIRGVREEHEFLAEEGEGGGGDM